MDRPRIALAAAAAVVVLGAGVTAALVVDGDEGDAPAAAATTTSEPADGVPAPAPEPPFPSTTATTLALPPVADDGVARALVTPTGVVVPVVEARADGSHRVKTPCAAEVVVAGGTPISGAHVVLDPGHGGDEPGAVAATGLTEKRVNLEVTERIRDRLEALGFDVVLTRTSDYRITLRSRAEIATALDVGAFVSIHHNAEPDGPSPGPGSETYYQIADARSKRLSGLIWEELVDHLATFDIAWAADTDAGAKFRLSSRGGDYYGVLSRTNGLPGVLVEAGFISNPPEAALMETAEYQAAEADAVTDAIVRFFTTEDPGSGFTEPYPREAPAGSGGGVSGCVDPPLT